jgi:hypothetical protein
MWSFRWGIEPVAGFEIVDRAFFDDLERAAEDPTHFLVGMGMFSVAGTGRVTPTEYVGIAFLLQDPTDLLFIGDPG